MICLPNSEQTQNIYDNPIFFAGYKELRERDSGFNSALEIPALRELLPSLEAKRVLDLGCGFGDFSRFAAACGALGVIAVDVSARMLEEATRLTDNPTISFSQCAIEDFVPAAISLDVVVSSMALHYVQDLRQVIDRLFEAIKPGGTLIFSVEHPICTANPVGRLEHSKGAALCWPLDRYQEEGIRTTRWFVENVIKYHRTTATYVSTLIEAGFRLDALREPRPLAEFVQKRPELDLHNRRPPVLLFRCSRE